MKTDRVGGRSRKRELEILKKETNKKEGRTKDIKRERDTNEKQK